MQYIYILRYKVSPKGVRCHAHCLILTPLLMRRYNSHSSQFYVTNRPRFNPVKSCYFDDLTLFRSISNKSTLLPLEQLLAIFHLNSTWVRCNTCKGWKILNNIEVCAKATKSHPQSSYRSASSVKLKYIGTLRHSGATLHITFSQIFVIYFGRVRHNFQAAVFQIDFNR